MHFVNGNLHIRQDTRYLKCLSPQTGLTIISRPLKMPMLTKHTGKKSKAGDENMRNTLITHFHSFLDGDYNKESISESVLGKLSFGFTLVTVIICCLGLFGLSTFAAEQTIKEIGVRKVLGAGITDIVILLSKEFAGLVVIAIILAIPTAYYFLNIWLQDFAHRIEISRGSLFWAGVSALLIALLTVNFPISKKQLPIRSTNNPELNKYEEKKTLRTSISFYSLRSIL